MNIDTIQMKKSKAEYSLQLNDRMSIVA